MFDFSFVDSVTFAFRALWVRRVIVLQMALLPFVIKLVSIIGINAFEIQENLLRQGLFFIPSYFVEGWLLARLIRIFILGEDIHPPLTGNTERDFERLRAYSRIILGGALAYVLTKLFTMFFASLVIVQNDYYTSAATPPVSDGASYIIGIIALAIMVWAYRFLWLYIPATLQLPIEDFIRRIRPYKNSLYFIGIWIMCFMPFMLAFIFFGGMADSLSGKEESIIGIGKYLTYILQTVTDLGISITATIAMAHFFKRYYK